MLNDQIALDHEAASGYYSLARQPLLQLLDATPRDILEIGCGMGATLAELKRRGARRVVGLELRADVVQRARSDGILDDVIVLNAETDRLPFDPQSFDLIILSHVLEHFSRPQDVLGS